MSYLLRPHGQITGGYPVRPSTPVTVGRESLNLIQVGHHTIADFHCRFLVGPDGLFVEPIGKAEVQVLGLSIQGRTRVPPGARIRIGAIELQAVQVEEAASNLPGFRSLLAEDARKLLRAMPWYSASILLHVALYLWLDRTLWMEHREAREIAVHSEVLAQPQHLLEDDVPTLKTLAMEDPLDLLAEPEVVLERPEDPGEPDALQEIPAFFTPDPAVLGSGQSGTGREGLRGGLHVNLDRGGGAGNGLVERLQNVRGRGMDVVFLVDTTSSMRPFLDQARQTVDAMVTQLSALVNDLRMGLVAYRDLGDEYLTKVLDLSSDRYELLNFLEDLGAHGGGDIPEAVASGLQAATQEVAFRPGAYRVLVLIGDAPPHEGSWTQIRSSVRTFLSGAPVGQAMVSAIFTGTSTMGSGREQETAHAFAEIARLGRGDFLQLDRTARVQDRLLLMTLGRSYESELCELLRQAREGPREALLRRKLAEKDREWLLDKLESVPVHPGVVNALMSLADERVLSRCRSLVVDEEEPLGVRRAALYILRKKLNPRVLFDLAAPAKRQSRAVAELDALIQRF